MFHERFVQMIVVFLPVMTGKNTPRFSDGRLYFQQIVADRITIKTQHEQVFVLPANMSVETDRVPSIKNTFCDVITNKERLLFLFPVL
jgi:hypothetical protein